MFQNITFSIQKEGMNMNRILTIIFTMGLLLGLVACGNNSESDVEKSTTDSDAKTEEQQAEDQGTDVEEEDATDESMKEEDATKDEDTEEEASDNPDHTNSAIADFEEASTIEEQIDIAGLDVEVKTDNQNNRVILFKDGDKAVYKTVYVKHDQRLKIIDIIDDEGQIYNEIIK